MKEKSPLFKQQGRFTTVNQPREISLEQLPLVVANNSKIIGYGFLSTLIQRTSYGKKKKKKKEKASMRIPSPQ